jgi:hypothetical protein
LRCALAERRGLGVEALPKASVGAKTTTVRLDSAKANGLLAAKLPGAGIRGQQCLLAGGDPVVVPDVGKEEVPDVVAA